MSTNQGAFLNFLASKLSYFLDTNIVLLILTDMHAIHEGSLLNYLTYSFRCVYVQKQDIYDLYTLYSPQPFWHHGPVLWNAIFSQMGVGDMRVCSAQ